MAAEGAPVGRDQTVDASEVFGSVAASAGCGKSGEQLKIKIKPANQFLDCPKATAVASIIMCTGFLESPFYTAWV